MAILRSRLTRRRDRAATTARGPLAEYYQVPIPPDTTPAGELPLLALDLECTSLDLARADILSIGWVPVTEGRVQLAQSRRVVIDTGADVGPSVLIHHMTDEVIRAGVPLGDALAAVLAAVAGRVLLAHHAVIEVTLLSRACAQLFGAPFVPPVIDTLVLQRHLLGRQWPGPDRTGLNLWEARAGYGLPRYRAHDALTDAVACGELFLAQLPRWSAPESLTLKSLRQR